MTAAGTGMTARFDAMLAEGRRRLGVPGAALQVPSAPPSAAARPAGEAERVLRERYGGGWTFAVSGRRREDGDAVVDGALRIAASGFACAATGRAPVSAVSGRAAGVAFRLGDPAAAFARAEADALARCVAVLPA